MTAFLFGIGTLTLLMVVLAAARVSYRYTPERCTRPGMHAGWQIWAYAPVEL